ncbi:MAG: hypothetical protein IT287_07515 [Bdellovibrionaceae bacterium]|nr:hypothetical protein [Pseudobdellovibrionaceae bacterium]
MSKWFSLLLTVTLFGCQSSTQFGAGSRAPSNTSAPEAWSYEAGPESSAMGKELIELNARIPNMPGLSEEVMGEQKFRPAFGPIPWRMLQKPNSVKILFIGQDGTHVAEAAGRPATAGFGGRAQDLANFFGVDYSAAFINTYSFTIRGQYGAFNTPYLVTSGNNQKLSFGGYTDNELWLMTHGADSPLNKWRSDLIDWIIRNNKDSLKLIVLFGGAARDAVSSFVVSRGGVVGARASESFIKTVKVPETKLVYAGGNNEFPVPISKQVKEVKDSKGAVIKTDDLYAQLLNRIPDYGGKNGEAEQDVAMKALTDNLPSALKDMVFSDGGLHDSGMLHSAQLGGYDLDKISINGQTTISLNGIKLSDGSTLQQDILIVDLPHPTALTNKKMDYDKWKQNPKGPEPETPEEAVRKATTVLQPYREKGWRIVPDSGQENRFDQRLEYRYGRGHIGTEYYDFGTPNNRMVSVSDAVRHSPPVIILGTRERAPFDEAKIAQMLLDKPAEVFPADEMFVARPRTAQLRDVFDRGPGEIYAKLMKQNLDMKVIGAPKEMVLKDTDVKSASDYDRRDVMRMKFGSDAFNIKTDPEKVGDFGHYRGTFQKPRVVILADPDGADDVLTSRALTGARGQYLHRLMKDVGVDDKYLIFKTVPFGMDAATEAEWKLVLGQTEKYRDSVFGKVINEERPILIMTDGPYAKKELDRMAIQIKRKINVVHIERTGSGNNSGIVAAGNEIKKLSEFSSVGAISGLMSNIPRSHLAYYSRLWEGTSGDRVIDSIVKPGLQIRKEKGGKTTFVPVHASYFRGLGFAVVAPNWVVEQKAIHPKTAIDDILKLKLKMCEEGLRLPKETVSDFMTRVSSGTKNCASIVK